MGDILPMDHHIVLGSLHGDDGTGDQWGERVPAMLATNKSQNR